MLEKKVLDLLNQELDGVNSEKERETVRKILQKKPQARKYFEDLQEMSLVLRRVKDVPAPTYLKARILTALPFPKQTVPARVIPARSFLRELRSNLRYRYAYMFAGGAVTGILLFTIFTGQPSDTANMTGTMASNQPAALAESRTDINLNEITGTIQARRFTSTVVTDFDLRVPQEVDVVVNYDRQVIQLDSFHPVSDAQGTLVVLEGQLRLTVAGQGKYQITFAGTPESRSPIAVRLFARGLLLSEYELSFEQKENH
jgi:hypothetical protein